MEECECTTDMTEAIGKALFINNLVPGIFLRGEITSKVKIVEALELCEFIILIDGEPEARYPLPWSKFNRAGFDVGILNTRTILEYLVKTEGKENE